jgi:hypothetical protein
MAVPIAAMTAKTAPLAPMIPASESAVELKKSQTRAEATAPPQVKAQVAPVTEHLLQRRAEADQGDHVGRDVKPEKAGITKHLHRMSPGIGEKRPIAVIGPGPGTERKRVAENVVAEEMEPEKLQQKHRDGRADKQPGDPRDGPPRRRGPGITRRNFLAHNGSLPPPQ